MLSPIATEAIYSATYVDNYIDSVENLPDDVQRHLSRIRDIDVQYRSLLRDVDHYYELWKTLQNVTDASSSRRTRAIARMQQSLIQAQELGDEKMAIVNQLQELIDHKTRQLDTDQKNLDIKEEEQMQMDECGGPTPVKQSRTQSPPRADATLVAGVANGGGGSERKTTGSTIEICQQRPDSIVALAGSGSSGAGGGGGGSTPNSERSSNGATNGTSNTSNSNLGGGDAQRSANKRSRRRNENASNSNSGNMELGGNESNSANEGGSNSAGGGGLVTQKSTAASGTQKKNASQNQTAAGGATSGAGIVSAAAAGGGGAGGGNNTGKKKKRKARGTQSSSAQASARDAREETPPPDPIDPDEPTYCVCNQISFGEMILCDNDLCPIEWFHFSCVSLVLKPKGRWYCPNCRGDRPNVMKPKAQFLKELERYNKEKEEKT